MSDCWFCRECGDAELGRFDYCQVCGSGRATAQTDVSSTADEDTEGSSRQAKSDRTLPKLQHTGEDEIDERATAINEYRSGAGTYNDYGREAVESIGPVEHLRNLPATVSFTKDTADGEIIDRIEETKQSRNNTPARQPIILDGVNQDKIPVVMDGTSPSPPSRDPEQLKERKGRPTQGDWVLIQDMDPNRPEIAHAVRQEALSSASETSPSSDEWSDTFQYALKLSATTSRNSTRYFRQTGAFLDDNETAELSMNHGVNSHDLHTSPDSASANGPLGIETEPNTHGIYGMVKYVRMNAQMLPVKSMQIAPSAESEMPNAVRENLQKTNKDGPIYLDQQSNVTVETTRNLWAQTEQDQARHGDHKTTLWPMGNQDTPLVSADDQWIHHEYSAGQIASEDEDDRHSVQSADTLLTLVSTLSGLTVVELEGATVELQKVFQQDADLTRLYRKGIQTASIGPERLQRNVGRLLRTFAQDLRREASKELEKITCRFVTAKSAYVAHCIVEELNDTPIQRQSNQKHERNDEAHNEGIELEDLAPVDEDYFEDLAALRMFLVNSIAFQNFREGLTQFVLPKEVQHSSDNIAKREEGTPTPFSRPWRISGSIGRGLRSMLVAMKCLEPPLQLGMVRLRWQCKCGDSFFEDVMEYRAGGVSSLVEQMQPSCIKVTATSYGEAGTSQVYFPKAFNSLRATWRKTSNAFKALLEPSESLPQHNDPQIAGQSCQVGLSTASSERLLLLAGLHKTRRRTYLAQDPVGKVLTDRQLFCFMKRQLDGRYNRTERFFSTTRVNNIHITKLCLRLGNNLEVRTHDPCCKYNSRVVCECVPPVSKVEGGQDPEYRCRPAGPLDYWPPVLSQYLVHRLEDPSCIHKDDNAILLKIPRRICGEIEAEIGREAEGWGIYYEEGLNLLWIAVLATMVFYLTGLLFGTFWAVSKDDLQGAFGVSGYFAAVCAGIVPLIAWVQNS